MFQKYKVEIEFTRRLLGTNPCDPNIMDTHILDRQRKMILEKSGVNKSINKYLDAIQISAERGDAEIDSIIAKLENLIGYELSEEEKALAIAGELDKLKETFKELDIKGTTVFFWNKEKNLPCIGDHMILGFLKASAEAIGRTYKTKAKGKVLESVSYTQSLLNQHVCIDEQFITFDKDIERDADGNPAYLQRSLRAMTAQGPRISLAKSEVISPGAKISFTLKVMTGSPITKEILERMFSYGEVSGLGQWRNAGNGRFTYNIAEIK